VLLQVIRLSDVMLRIPEDIRSKMLVDDDIDAAECFVPQHSRVNRARLEKNSLAQARGVLFVDWRDCDGKSFGALKFVTDSMLTSESIVADDVLLLGLCHAQAEMRQLVEALNTHLLFAELRSIARNCWKPLL
jgi:hypothetical protein